MSAVVAPSAYRRRRSRNVTGTVMNLVVAALAVPLLVKQRGEATTDRDRQQFTQRIKDKLAEMDLERETLLLLLGEME